MNYLDWVIGRTAGHLAGNRAYYEAKKQQSGSEPAPSEQQHLARQMAEEFTDYQQAGGKEDIESWVKNRLQAEVAALEATENRMRTDLAELTASDEQMNRDVARKLAREHCGPDDPEFEEACLAQIKLVDRMLDYYESLKEFETEEGARFVEVDYFAGLFSNSEVLMNHVFRVDIREQHVNHYVEWAKKNDERAFALFKRLFPNPNALAHNPNDLAACVINWLNTATEGHTIRMASYMHMKPGHPEPIRKDEYSLELDWDRYKVERKTTACPDCGGVVSLKAASCPHCGNPDLSEK